MAVAAHFVDEHGVVGNVAVPAGAAAELDRVGAAVGPGRAGGAGGNLDHQRAVVTQGRLVERVEGDGGAEVGRGNPQAAGGHGVERLQVAGVQADGRAALRPPELDRELKRRRGEAHQVPAVAVDGVGVG